jgi:hypothetical protein
MEEVLKMNKKGKKVGMIDFQKYRIVAISILELRHYQKKRFSYHYVKPIANMLIDHLLLLSEKDLYLNSKQCEPASLV